MSQDFPIEPSARGPVVLLATEGQTNFTGNYPLQEEGDVLVELSTDGGTTWATQILGQDYTVSGAGQAGGFTILFTTGLSVNDQVRHTGKAPIQNTTNFSAANSVKASGINDKLDRIFIHLQEIGRDLGDITDALGASVMRLNGAGDAWDGKSKRIGAAGDALYDTDLATLAQVKALAATLQNAAPVANPLLASRNALALATIPAEIDAVQTLGNSTPGDALPLPWKSVAAEPAAYEPKVQDAGGGWWQVVGETRNIRDHYGVDPDGTTDATAAVQTAFDWVRSAGGKLVFNQGAGFRLTNEINMLQVSGVSYHLAGENEHNSILIADFIGCDKVMLKARDAQRNKNKGNIVIERLHFTTSAATRQLPSPVMLEIDGPAQLRMSNLRFDRSNNTIMRLNSANNSHIENIWNFNGGRSYLRKRVGNVTVSMASGTNVIDAGGVAIFDASLAGKLVFIDDNTHGGKFATIQTPAGDGKSATTYETAETDFSGIISFGHARASMTAGSNVVEFDCNCMSADENGVYIYIQDAGVDGDLLYGYLQYVAANQATLWYVAPGGVMTARNAATTTPAGGSLFGSAAFDFSREDLRIYDSGATWAQYAADLYLTRLHTESSWGIQIAANKAVEFWMNQCKMHADAVVLDSDLVTPTNYVGQTLASLWISQSTGGVHNNQFVANPTGPQGHMYAVNMAGGFAVKDNNWTLSYGDKCITYKKPAVGSNDVGAIHFTPGHFHALIGDDIPADAILGGDTDRIVLDGPGTEARGSADKGWNWLSKPHIWHPTSDERARMRHATDFTDYWTQHVVAGKFLIKRKGATVFTIPDAAAGTPFPVLPVFKGSTTAGSVPYSTQLGYYWNWGPLVFVAIRLITNGAPTGMGGSLRIGNLPFQVSALDAALNMPLSCGAWKLNTSYASADLAAYATPATYDIGLQVSQNNSAISAVLTTALTAAGDAITVSGLYIAATIP